MYPKPYSIYLRGSIGFRVYTGARLAFELGLRAKG